MARFLEIAASTKNYVKSSPTPPVGGKIYYDPTQCWQYKVVYDMPGCYSLTFPEGVTCARTVLVGGGGRPRCTGPNCQSWAGSGGGYSEKCMTVSGPNTSLCIVVGLVEQNSTLQCNGTTVHTATGAFGNVRGCGVGGDHNSFGGCGGCTCNNCAGSVSHYCGSCICTGVVTCCGYCIVIACKEGNSGGTTCCNTLFSGGGSAGSPVHICGGCGQDVCGWCWSGVAGGGGGIGVMCMCAWHYNCCSCICWHFDGNVSCQIYCTNYPGSAGGGGGTLFADGAYTCAAQPRSFAGTCGKGQHQGGNGLPGGRVTCEGQAARHAYWYVRRYNESYGGSCCDTWGCMHRPQHDPARSFPQDDPTSTLGASKNNPYPYQGMGDDWWDISCIQGTGGAGFVAERTWNDTYETGPYGGMWAGRPQNAGEGAGTGGVMTYCCRALWFQSGQVSADFNASINWDFLCYLGKCACGTGGTCCPDFFRQAWRLRDAIVPYFVSCAGTLGGSGGMNWCDNASKAGFGGGGGQVRRAPLCVCYGGNYNYYGCVPANGLLPFPPCLLDSMMSNAGSGLAIVYYKEA